MNITATADQVAHLQDGRIVIVMQHRSFCATTYAMDCDCEMADLVAVTEPCKTCGGNPSAEDHMCSKSRVVPVLDIRKPGEHCDCSWENDVCHWCGIEWLGDGDYRCPDCDNAGHPLFDLKVECDCACHRLKSKYPGLSHDVLGKYKRDGSCVDGFVTHTGLYVPGPLAVIYPGDDNPDESSYHGPAHIEYNANGPSRWYPAWDGSLEWDDGFDITLPPAARPGWYAVIAERRKT